MAVSLLAHEISDLCLAKPALRCLPLSASLADALAALKSSEDTFLSVWDCRCHRRHLSPDPLTGEPQCRCLGKVSMVDIICFLAGAADADHESPAKALKTPLSRVLPKTHGIVLHLESSSSLAEAIDLILQGAQNLIVPIRRRRRKQLTKTLIPSATGTTITVHNGTEFCWLTQDDVVRFLLSSIGLFSPIPSLSLQSLGIIDSDGVLAADYHSPAISALGLISKSLSDQTSVAVVDADGVLIGEISPLTLASCGESASAAIATLSAGDLMAYIDGGNPPEDLVRVVNRRLREKSLDGAFADLGVFEISSQSSSSSDEEWNLASPTTTLPRSGRYSRSASYSARMVRRAEAIVCHPKSSLVAVMIQAIAHRVNYVWVVDDGSCLVGIVTFSAILKVFRESTVA